MNTHPRAKLGLAARHELVKGDRGRVEPPCRRPPLTLIDRRPGSGGHWLDAYPFVRLHTPSAYYGVNSLALGEDRIDDLRDTLPQH